MLPSPPPADTPILAQVLVISNVTRGYAGAARATMSKTRVRLGKTLAWANTPSMGERRFPLWRRLGRFVAGSLLAFGAAGSSAASAAPANVGTPEFARIGSDALAGGKAPGFAFVVVRDGEIVYRGGFGFADIAHRTPVTPDTRFAIGSLTKQFTAAAILLLARRGQLALDDRLATYEPSIKNADTITLRMLLHQTSGVHNYPMLSEHPWPTAGRIPVDSLIPVFASDPSDFVPGSRYAYSNTNYALLAAIVAKVSGLDEAAFLQREFFDPLGMHASGYGFAAQQRPGTAIPYLGTAPFKVQPSISPDLYSGAGAMISTAPDLAAWDIALMRGTLLDESGRRALWTAGTLNDGSITDYAMGFIPGTIAGHRVVWHNGLAPGSGGYCYNAIFPDDHLAVIVLSNGYGFEGVPEQMASRVIDGYFPPLAGREDPAITARAKDWWTQLQTGQVDRSHLTPTFAALLTPAFLAQIKGTLAALGTPSAWTFTGSRTVPGVVIYSYRIRVADGEHTLDIGLTPDGRIAGSQLR